MFRIRSLKDSKAFSMIELLVVMFLIAFMIAFLTVVFVNQTKRGKVIATQTLLHKLEVGLSDYYTAFGEYPPDSGYGLDPGKGTSGGKTYFDAGTLYRYLGKQVQWKKVTDNGIVDKGSYGPFIKDFLNKELKKYDDPVWGDSFMVVDPWLTPIGYIGSKARVMHKRDSVDLFSAGPDKKTASDDTGFDHGWPQGCDHDNISYDGIPGKDNAQGLGYAVLNGGLTAFKKDKKIGNKDDKMNEVLDDINNWDPEQ